MNAVQKLKREILLLQWSWDDYHEEHPEITDENVDSLYQSVYDEGDLHDAIYEIRSSGIDTNIQCEYSRHYESNSVAFKCVDGSWIGWTYWYGGGKHGEPESIDWIEYAYEVNCIEEEKVVTVQTFSKSEVK